MNRLARMTPVLLGILAAACGPSPADRSLPVYTSEQTDSAHAGYRRTTVSTAGGAVYVNDLEEQALQLYAAEPTKKVGRGPIGDASIYAIDGQDPSAWLAVDVGSEMPAYAVFRNVQHPPFDWRHASFQHLRLAVPAGPAANKDTTDAALIEDVVRTLRDGTPVNPPLAPQPMPVGGSPTGVYTVLLVSDQLPGIVFRPSCYLAASGEVYLAESVVTTFTRPLPSFSAAWIPASPKFTEWTKTPPAAEPAVVKSPAPR